jgi:hypothetical protein
MNEDLNRIAQLKFNKEVESITRDTREKMQEAQREYAALTGSYVGHSGQHEASIGRIQIDGAEQTVRALYRIWVDLIMKRNGHISRPDITFIASRIDDYARTKTVHLRRAFALQRRGAAINVLTQEAERSMYAVAASLRMDLEIMVREFEAFPNIATSERDTSMTQQPKRRFSPGRRVLVGIQSRPGKIASVDDQPSVMGEFRHVVAMDADGQVKEVLGCDLQAFPELDEDLSNKQPLPVASSIFHGDQIINFGTAGALGKGAQGIVNVYEQSTSVEQQVDLNILAVQLEQLRTEFRKTATSREDDKQLALLGDAAEAAEKGDGKGVASILSRVGKGVLNLAKDIGTDVAAKVIVEITKGN